MEYSTTVLETFPYKNRTESTDMTVDLLLFIVKCFHMTMRLKNTVNFFQPCFSKLTRGLLNTIACFTIER